MGEIEEIWRTYVSQKAEDTSLMYGNHIISTADFFEWCVDQHPHNTAVMSVDPSHPSYTYLQLDEMANKVANWSISHGIVAGDVIALMLENRPEYLYITMGFAKAGVTIALINVNLKDNFLFHALKTAQPKIIIVSALYRANWLSGFAFFQKENVLPPCLWWFGSIEEAEKKEKAAGKKRKVEERREFDESIAPFPTTRLEKKTRLLVRPRDPLFYIYTSGTTGQSKAAKFSHLRFIGCALTWTRPSGITEKDIYYICLPLYHGNAGCVAVAPCLFMGATMVLRHKFSVSSFWNDIKEFKCTAMIYIGELWRYLETQPPREDEQNHTLRVIIGNGLRPETWKNVVSRFNIRLVVEHYGSTEMPGDAILNYFNKIGSCGFVPPSVWKEREAKLIAYDVETESVMRNENGFCIECEPNVTGEIIFKLPDGKYDGYVGKEETEKKLYKNVFQAGDTWWSSGDLLKMDEEGFFYFVDRIGDTFRWKGENVSTNEVCEVFQGFPGIQEANVYGVEVYGYPGKAGMASISIKSEISRVELLEHVKSKLPAYAIPLFLRVKLNEENDKTATLKFQKYQYFKQGFDPAIIKDSLFFLDPSSGCYVPLTLQVYKDIRDGKYKL